MSVGDRIQIVNWNQPLFKGRFDSIALKKDETATPIDIKIVSLVEVVYENSESIGKILWASSSRLFSDKGVFNCQSNGLFAKSKCTMISKFDIKLIDWGQVGNFFWTITQNSPFTFVSRLYDISSGSMVSEMLIQEYSCDNRIRGAMVLIADGKIYACQFGNTLILYQMPRGTGSKI